MITDSTLTLTGVAEVTRRLYQFSDRLGDRVTLLALRSGANYMLKKIRDAEPVKTGRLRRATKVSQSKIHTRRRDGQVGVYLQVKKGKKRSDPNGAYYGIFLENGYIPGKAGTTREARRQRHNTQAHRRIPGRHFVSSTFNATKESAAQLIVNNIELAGRQLASSLGF